MPTLLCAHGPKVATASTTRRSFFVSNGHRRRQTRRSSVDGHRRKESRHMTHKSHHRAGAAARRFQKDEGSSPVGAREGRGWRTDSKGKIVLRAGTVVKHGTTSTVIRHVLGSREGLLGATEADDMHSRRSALREQHEPQPSVAGGVYVAENFLAYSAAAIAFTSKIRELTDEATPPGQLLMQSDFETMLEKLSQSLIGSMPEDVDDIPLPVVLNIRLQEDCQLVADEDYWLDFQSGLARHTGRVIAIGGSNPQVVNEALDNWKVSPAARGELVACGGIIWECYGTGAIVRPGGIPADWIESLEMPHVVQQATLESMKEKRMQLPSFAGGCWDAVESELWEAAALLKISTAVAEDMQRMYMDTNTLMAAHHMTTKRHTACQGLEWWNESWVPYVQNLKTKLWPRQKGRIREDIGRFSLGTRLLARDLSGTGLLSSLRSPQVNDRERKSLFALMVWSAMQNAVGRWGIPANM